MGAFIKKKAKKASKKVTVLYKINCVSIIIISFSAKDES